MSKRDDMKAALELREPAVAVPIWELGFHCWDQASGRHVVLGREFEALSARQQDEAMWSNAHIMAEVCEQMNFAGLHVPGGYWETAPGVPAYNWPPEPARWRQTEFLHEVLGGRVMLVGGSGGVICPPSKGFEEFCYRLFDAPEEIDRMARRTLESGLATARRMRDLGVEGVVTASDIANNHGSFFSPPQMQRFILPYLHQWAQGARAMGLYAILHTDGEVSPYLEDIAASGVHALQAIDPVADMDIAKVKKQVGDRLCLCGNVDCGLLLRGPAQAVYEQTRDVILSCKDGSAFVLGASNAVVEQTPIEHYRQLQRAWRDFGPYRRVG